MIGYLLLLIFLYFLYSGITWIKTRVWVQDIICQIKLVFHKAYNFTFQLIKPDSQ